MSGSNKFLGGDVRLPQPRGEAAKRGAKLFERLLRAEREQGREQPGSDAPAAAATPPTGAAPAAIRASSPRRYTLALSKIGAEHSAAPTAAEVTDASVPAAAEAPPRAAEAATTTPTASQADAPPPSDGPGRQQSGDTDTSQIGPAQASGNALPEEDTQPMQQGGRASAMARPPAGAPAVRASVAEPRAETVPQTALETAADGVMLLQQPDGSTAFEIDFSDATFADLTCRISFTNGQVRALFRVPDADARRLLESEAGRLRARLEERGLRVDAVEIEQRMP